MDSKRANYYGRIDYLSVMTMYSVIDFYFLFIQFAVLVIALFAITICRVVWYSLPKGHCFSLFYSSHIAHNSFGAFRRKDEQ